MNRLAWITSFVAWAIVAGIGGYWEWFDNPEVLTHTDYRVDSPVQENTFFTLHASFCIQYEMTPRSYTRTLTNVVTKTVYVLPDSPVIFHVGCITVSRQYAIQGVPPGTYVYGFVASYGVNPIKSIQSTTYSTPFKIIAAGTKEK